MSTGHGQGLLLSLGFEVLVVGTLWITVFFDRCHIAWQFITNVSKGNVTPIFREQAQTLLPTAVYRSAVFIFYLNLSYRQIS